MKCDKCDKEATVKEVDRDSGVLLGAFCTGHAQGTYPNAQSFRISDSQPVTQEVAGELALDLVLGALGMAGFVRVGEDVETIKADGADGTNHHPTAFAYRCVDPELGYDCFDSGDNNVKTIRVTDGDNNYYLKAYDE